MSQRLQYYDHTSRLKDPSYRAEAFTHANEAHELAADVQHVGAVALFSEVQTAGVIGSQATVRVPNPVAGYIKSKNPLSSVRIGRERHRSITAALAGADGALSDLQAGLDGHVVSQGTNTTFHSVAPGSRGLDVLRKMPDGGNQEIILQGADMPPFFTVSKNLSAENQAKRPDEFGWHDWFQSASDEQLINFAQWYTERLKVLADPESRARYVNALKTDYKDRVATGMRDGWIPDGRAHRAALAGRMARADVRFFSPFGTMPDHYAGVTQRRTIKDIIALPTIPGKQVTVHELGHVFAGIQRTAMLAFFTSKTGRKQFSEKKSSILRMYTILNEGYNDHMTAALIEGDPRTIIPAERDANGVVAAEGNSALYKAYREIFGVLIGGKDGKVTNADMRETVEAMMLGNFGRFAYQLHQKWDGRDVLLEMLEIVNKHDLEQANDLDNPDYTEASLAKKVVERLRKTPIALTKISKRG